MSEAELSKVVEITTEEQRIFLEAIELMPASGIAFGGDPIVRAEVLQGGLKEPQINYILFTPPNLRPKIWGEESERLYQQLKSAINMALVFADPWRVTGATSSIEDPNFTSYIDYFTHNTGQLPAITWFTEAHEGLFEEVINFGKVWFDYKMAHVTGNIATFGTIPANNVQPIIVLSNEDIRQAEENLVAKLGENGIPNTNSLRGRILQKVRDRLNYQDE